MLIPPRSQTDAAGREVAAVAWSGVQQPEDANSIKLALLPVDEDGRLSDQVQTVDVPQAAGLTLDPSSAAPDGYRFEYVSSSGGLFTGLWGGSYRHYHVLVKDGRRIKVPDTRYRYNARLIGWVTRGELRDQAGGTQQP